MKKRVPHLLSAFVFAGFLFMALASGDNKKGGSSSGEAIKEIGLGQALPTDYFDITVNKVSFEKSIDTGNQFASLPSEAGSVYLVMNVTFKNTDSESRMLTDGEVQINYNGKDYVFDKSEMIMLEGWGLMLDQINPLTSKTTNLVYKLPSELKGNLYYKPGRASSEEIISLGSI